MTSTVICPNCRRPRESEQLVQCPFCKVPFVPSLDSGFTPDQERAVRRMVSWRVWSILVGGFSLLGILGWIRSCFMVRDITANLESVVRESVAQQFSEPRIQTTLNEVAANQASAILTQAVAPEVDKFREKVEPALAQIEDARARVLAMDADLRTLQQATAPLRFTAVPVVFERSGDDYVATIQFLPDKEAALGHLIFRVQVLEPPTTLIRVFMFNGPMAAQAWPAEISPDQHTSQLEIAPMSFGTPRVKLVLSGPAQIRIDGNHGPDNYILKVPPGKP